MNLILIIIYIIIFLFIIIKSFYNYIKLNKTEKINTLIEIETIPFILNKNRIDLSFILIIFLITVFFNINLFSENIAYCQDSDESKNNDDDDVRVFTPEEHEVWFDESQRLGEDFERRIDALRNHKASLFVESGHLENIDRTIYNLNLLERTELMLHKEFEGFEKKSLMPSFTLRESMNILYSSVKETYGFLKNFNEYLIQANTNNPHNRNQMAHIRIFGKISSKILHSIRSFDENFEWSDDAEEDIDDDDL